MGTAGRCVGFQAGISNNGLYRTEGGLIRCLADPGEPNVALAKKLAESRLQAGLAARIGCPPRQADWQSATGKQPAPQNRRGARRREWIVVQIVAARIDNSTG